MSKTFSVHVWYMSDDPGKEGHWHCHRASVRKWTLRHVLRKLYGEGWSNVSILVSQNE